MAITTYHYLSASYTFSRQNVCFGAPRRASPLSWREKKRELSTVLPQLESNLKMITSFSIFRFTPVHFALTIIQVLHSNAFIYGDEKGVVEAVLFTDNFSQFREPYNSLYFNDASLAIRCQLRNQSWDNSHSRNALVKQYADQEMSPTVTLRTLDCSKSYKIEELVEDESVYWTVNISKQEVLEHCGAERNGKVPWTYKLELEKDLNLFESWGTVVFPDVEPLLSIELGDVLDESVDILAPKDAIFWQHPCSPGVAVLVPLSKSEQPFKGIPEKYRMKNNIIIINLISLCLNIVWTDTLQVFQFK